MSNQSIDGKTLKRIQRALLQAYPQKVDLAQLVRFELDQNLDVIAASDALGSTVFKLLGWAESHGQLDVLVLAAAKERPHSKELQALAVLFSKPPEAEAGIEEASVSPAPAGSAPPPTASLPELEITDPLAEPYSRLEASLTEKDWAAALVLADNIQAQNPHYRAVLALRNWAQQELDKTQKPAPQPEKMVATPKTKTKTAKREKIVVPSVVSLVPDPPIVHKVGGLEFVEIPAGEFWMGSEDGQDNEKPRHKVYLDTYRIGRTPVTNAQYREFVQATGRDVPKHWQKGWFTKSTVFPVEKANHPVVYVSWEDAQAYCRWLSEKTGQRITLPTEAQWEKAACGPEGFVFPWGNTFDAHRHNSKESGIGDTTPVDKYPLGASPYGVWDMSGNVWEWVQDWFASDYYAQSPSINPPGPAEGKSKVLRGGSWYDDIPFVRSAVRGAGSIDSFFPGGGFRCAQEVSP